jgi:prophage maintenance system killer protein
MNMLELDHFLDTNEEIHQRSLKDKKIEYGGFEDYPIRTGRLEALIKKAPKDDVLDTATYYLKNMILMQPFADANHRTALMVVELFLKKNGFEFKYTADESYEFQKRLYSLRYKVYHTYEEIGTKVLSEGKNEVYAYCKEFLEKHLSKRN